MKLTDKYVFFWSGWPSQWWPCKFTFGGQEYNCAEQAMMAAKAKMFNDQSALARIMETEDPATQKWIGRHVENFDKDAWEKSCLDIVTEINVAKFDQNPHLKRHLLKTHDKIIVEASPEDKIWGIGLHESDPRCLDETKWQGKNWLGIALMRARERLREKENGN